MKLTRNFYNRPTLQVAQDLLGCFLIRKVGNRKIIGRITETEAYVGPNDLASHASRGRTPRTEIMFGPPGYAYVYLVYGMYYMFNIVTERDGFPAAVLIRAVEPVVDKAISHRAVSYKPNGPGKLCRWYGIDRKLNGIDLCGNEMWVDMRINIQINANYDSNFKIKKAKRVGVDYAGPWENKLWRFYIEGNR